MIQYCRCCTKVLGPLRTGEFCQGCAEGILDDVCRLQNLTAGEILTVSDILATVGAFFLARAMLHVLPKEGMQ